MHTAIEISLYPLDADYIPPIKAFIERLNTYPELNVIDQRDEHADRRRASAPVRNPGEGDRARRSREAGRKVFVMKVLGGVRRRELQ